MKASPRICDIPFAQGQVQCCQKESASWQVLKPSQEWLVVIWSGDRPQERSKQDDLGWQYVDFTWFWGFFCHKAMEMIDKVSQTSSSTLYSHNFGVIGKSSIVLNICLPDVLSCRMIILTKDGRTRRPLMKWVAPFEAQVCRYKEIYVLLFFDSWYVIWMEWSDFKSQHMAVAQHVWTPVVEYDRFWGSLGRLCYPNLWSI